MLKIRSILKSDSGASAVELALMAPLLMLPLVSAVDLGIYLYSRVQVEFAAQAAVSAVQQACGYTNLPVTDTTKCANNSASIGKVKTAITNAVQSTALGSQVTVPNCTSGANCWEVERFLCVDNTGQLQAPTGATWGTLNTSTNTVTAAGKPANCTGVAGASASAKPINYVIIKTKFNYSPLFGGVSIATLLRGNIQKEAWLRVG